MPNSENSISHAINSYLGLPNTCAGKIARVFAAVAACAFTCAFSSTIAAAGIYFFDYGQKAECSATALSSLAISSSIFGLACSTIVVCIGCTSCSNCDVYSSPASSRNTAAVTNPHGVSPDSLPSYNINSDDSPSLGVNSDSPPSHNARLS